MAMKPVQKVHPAVRAALAAWVEWLRVWHLSEGQMHRANELWDRRAQIISGRPGNPVLADAIAAESAQSAWAEAINMMVMEYTVDWRICLLGAALELSHETIAKELRCERKRVGLMMNAALRLFTIDVSVSLFAKKRQDAAAAAAQAAEERYARGLSA